MVERAAASRSLGLAGWRLPAARAAAAAAFLAAAALLPPPCSALAAARYDNDVERFDGDAMRYNSDVERYKRYFSDSERYVLEAERHGVDLDRHDSDAEHFDSNPAPVTFAKRRKKTAPWIKPGAKALVVLSHWVPGLNKNHSEQNRLSAERILNRTALEIHRYGIDATILLVTNDPEENSTSFFTNQVVVGWEPACNSTFHHKFCVPWEALKVMRNASSGWKPGCNLDLYGSCGEPVYDYYMYSESDILTPKSTFEFWALHADELYQRGFLLLPHREERFNGTLVATDCYYPTCMSWSRIFRDGADAKGYEDTRDRIYIKPANPYAGTFLMTRQQFLEWLRSRMWDYSTALRHSKPRLPPIKQWGKRESATGGLLFAPGHGPEKGLTHLKMATHHLRHMKAVPFKPEDYHTIAEMEKKVSHCYNNPGCKDLPARASRRGMF